MNTDTIIRNNLKRFKSKNRSDWNHIVYNKNHYICPNKFYDKNCVTIFENSYSHNDTKYIKKDIYKKRSRINNMTRRKIY